MSTFATVLFWSVKLSSCGVMGVAGEQRVGCLPSLASFPCCFYVGASSVIRHGILTAVAANFFVVWD